MLSDWIWILLEQELIKAPEIIICIPADARQKSSFLFQEGPEAMIKLAPSTRKPLLGFAMSVVVSFQDDYHNVVGLGIRCLCTWKTKDGFYDKLERLFQCWAPTEAPKVEWDHIFIFYDTEMHPSGIEENLKFWADEVKFEFRTVSWDKKILGAHCSVTLCGVEVITASTNDTIPSEITRESEATISVIEEHPPTSSRVLEAKTPNPPSSSEPREVSSAHRKLRSKGTMLWKWVKRIRRDKKKKTSADREQLDLKPAAIIRSEGNTPS